MLQSLAQVEKMWELSELNYRNKQHPDDFPELPEIPAERFTREDFFQLEKEHVWKRTWLLAGIACELPSPGSFKAVSINDAPVLLARGEDGKIRAFYNTCQHRGSMLAKGEGTAQHFACSYHCWTYDLEGNLKFIPDERLFPNLDKSRKSLKPIRCELFGALIFINFDGDASPLAEFLGSILGVLQDMPLDNIKLYKKLQFEVPYNWKIVQENFSEAYHTKFIHPTSLEPFIQTKARAGHLLANGHAALAIKSRGSLTNLWASDVDDKEGVLNELTRKSQRNCNIFPNITLSPAENIFPVLVAWPISIQRTRLDVYFLTMPSSDQVASEPGYEATVAGLEVVLGEDFSALEGIQEAISSGGIEAVRLGWEEQIIYHHHQQIDRLIGSENIPAGLAVQDITLPVGV
uniref:Putative Rieske dioxygenase alpha subunit n=1 Tax=Sphingomonas sp. KSM1 TaxID=1228049 RepID=M1VHL2_9SPHN|nr:putative Rieske dioxygenase alpha subunit [Sphingomonas sp. KSM1]